MIGDLLYNIKFPDLDRRDELFPQSRVSESRKEILAGSGTETVSEV
jgi:hypothetical protein